MEKAEHALAAAQVALSATAHRAVEVARKEALDFLLRLNGLTIDGQNRLDSFSRSSNRCACNTSGPLRDDPAVSDEALKNALQSTTIGSSRPSPEAVVEEQRPPGVRSRASPRQRHARPEARPLEREEAREEAPRATAATRRTTRRRKEEAADNQDCFEEENAFSSNNIAP